MKRLLFVLAAAALAAPAPLPPRPPPATATPPPPRARAGRCRPARHRSLPGHGRRPRAERGNRLEGAGRLECPDRAGRLFPGRFRPEPEPADQTPRREARGGGPGSTT